MNDEAKRQPHLSGVFQPRISAYGWSEQRQREEELMGEPRVYVDLNGVIGENEYRTDGLGTMGDMAHYGFRFAEGQPMKFWVEDIDGEGNDDPMIFEGTFRWSSEREQWIVVVDEDSFRNVSESRNARGL